jgi:hypothetical protein
VGREAQASKDKASSASTPSAAGSATDRSYYNSQLESFVDSIESSSVKRLLEKFPYSEMEAKSINTTDWVNSIFSTKVEGDKQYVTVPKNCESFMDSLFMITLMRVFATLKWIPVLSTRELPTGVLETREGAFFAGFISASLRSTTGPMDTGTTKYAKGVKAFQTFSVEKEFGRSIHLRSGGMDKITERLSVMKGFTKDYWGLRGALAAIFKATKPVKVSHLSTYFKSKSEIMKNIKTKLLFKNGGVFRAEELAYLSQRYSKAQEELESFLLKLDNPTEELAKNFSEYYGRLKSILEQADNEIKPTVTSRARILFPTDKKKNTLKFLKLGLLEKLQTIGDDKMVTFMPETLPGISVFSKAPSEDWGSANFKKLRYGVYEDQYVVEVIDSFYGSFDLHQEVA